METRTLVRACLAVLAVLSVATLAQGYVTYSDAGGDGQAQTGNTEVEKHHGEYTVVTTSERTKDGERNNAIVVYDREGSVVYYNASLRVYNDVDPVAGRNATVMYVGARRLSRDECHATTGCWLNVVQTLNLTTGETRTVYARITSMNRGQWHDVDRMGPHRLLVADIALDRVFIVNTTAGVVEWEWQAQSEFPMKGGGMFPGDWTHVNDVELLPDGRVMASLRNQDQVVFVDRQRGLQANWTLGSEDNHSTLYEQHNPDYIPPQRGGPAVLVADSENNRVVEYQRTRNGTWREAWTWEDPQLMWPRDVDRLPNGNTLITDSNGGRVLEINPQGQVVWQVEINGAYDAERLGTGDESAGGHTADERYATSSGGGTAPGGANGTAAPDAQSASKGPIDRVFLWLKELAPRLVINGVLYVLPSWVGFVEFVALVVLGLTGAVWALLELRWAGWAVRIERSGSP